MKLTPLFDRVMISPIIEDHITSSGIVLPKTSQERPEIGIVEAVGDGENLDNNKSTMKVNVGDKVVFNKYAGTELKLDNITYVVLRQIDIIGVLHD